MNNFINQMIFERMTTYNLSDVVRTLQQDLSALWGSQNLIKINVDRKLPEIIVGDSDSLISKVKLLAGIMAENLVNGVLQLEFHLLENHSEEVIAEIKIVGIGTDEFILSSRFDQIQNMHDKILFQLGDQNIQTTKVGNRATIQFTQNLLTKPNSTNKDLLGFKGKRILIVEDNEANTIVFTCFLEDWGVQYTTVYNGLSAVNFALSREYDAILMDIHMPIMNGIDAIREIRKANKKIPIIVLSGRNQQEDVDAAMSAGANSFIKKPVLREELFSALSKHF